MLRNFLIILSIISFSFVACDKQEITPNENLTNDMRTRPPCYEIAIESALLDSDTFKDALSILTPLSVEAKDKGCFNEFLQFIIEIQIELYGSISSENETMVYTFYE